MPAISSPPMKTAWLWCRRPMPPTSSRRRRTSITRSTRPFPSSRSSSRSRKLSPSSAESSRPGGAPVAQTSPSVSLRRRDSGHETGHTRRRKRRSRRIGRHLRVRQRHQVLFFCLLLAFRGSSCFQFIQLLLEIFLVFLAKLVRFRHGVDVGRLVLACVKLHLRPFVVDVGFVRLIQYALGHRRRNEG